MTPASQTTAAAASDVSRTAQLVLWSGLVALGARRGGWLGTMALGYGVERLARLTLGRSLWLPVWQRLRALADGVSGSAAEPTQRFGDGDRDLVDQASWESFPASDPPGRGIA